MNTDKSAREFQKYTFRDIEPTIAKEKIMPNGNTAIAITGIVAATLFGIVALLVNSETKVNIEGSHNKSSAQVEIEQSSTTNQKQLEIK